MKKHLIFLTSIILVLAIAYQFKPIKETVNNVSKAVIFKADLINKESLTISSRVRVPKGYKRVNYPKGSF